MTVQVFRCGKCRTKHSIQAKHFPKFAGKTIRCRNCNCSNVVPGERMPAITEFCLAQMTLQERWSDSLHGCWDRLVIFWRWLRAEPKRSWMAIVVCVVLLLLGYREVQELREGWRLNKAIAYRNSLRKEIAANSLAAAQKQLELYERTSNTSPGIDPPQNEIAESSTGAPADNEVEPSPEDEDLLLKLDEINRLDGQLVATQALPSAFPVHYQARDLRFENGSTVLIPARDNVVAASYRGMASTANSVSGISLVVHRGDRRGLVSFFGTDGLVRSIATDLHSVSHLQLSPDGRFLATVTYLHGARKTTIIDTGSNKRLVQSDGTPLCFSPDSRYLAIYMDSGELRFWDTGTDFDATGGPFQVATELKLGRVIAAAFIRPELLLAGTKEGDLVLIDVPVSKILDRAKVELAVEKIWTVAGEDKAVLQLGFENNEYVASGQVTVAWFNCLIRKTEGDQEIAVSRFHGRLWEKGRKPGDYPFVTKDGRHMAILERWPTGESSNATRPMVSIYSTREPNKLLRVMDSPMHLAYFCCFGNSGTRLYGVSLDGRYVVLDLNLKKAFVVGEADKNVQITSPEQRAENTIHSIDDRHFAAAGKTGKVTLFRLPDCLEQPEALNEKTGIPRSKIRQIGNRYWTSHKSSLTSTRATTLGYENGRLLLRTADGITKPVRLTDLARTDREYVGWIVGGATDERAWQLGKGASPDYVSERIYRQLSGKQDNSTTITGRIIRVEGPAVFMKEKGMLVRRAKADFSEDQLAEIEQMGQERFRNLLPYVEQIPVVADFDGPTPLEGAWEIVDGQMFGYSIPKSYPDRKSRTIEFQGNRMYAPVFSVPASKVTSWSNHRFIYYSFPKILVRCVDGLGACHVDTSLSVKQRGDRLELQHLIPSGAGATWVLRRIQENETGKEVLQ